MSTYELRIDGKDGRRIKRLHKLGAENILTLEICITETTQKTINTRIFEVFKNIQMLILTGTIMPHFLCKTHSKICTYVKIKTQPDCGCIHIPKHTFRGLKGLKTVQLTTPTNIGEGAFENSDLCDIEGGNYIETIGPHAFAGTRLRMFSSLAHEIGPGAFMNCKYLKHAIFLGAKKLSKKAFFNCEQLHTFAAPNVHIWEEQCMANTKLQNIKPYGYVSKNAFEGTPPLCAIHLIRDDISTLRCHTDSNDIDNLTHIYIYMDNVKVINEDTVFNSFPLYKNIILVQNNNYSDDDYISVLTQVLNNISSSHWCAFNAVQTHDKIIYLKELESAMNDASNV